jgi:MFS family permease
MNELFIQEVFMKKELFSKDFVLVWLGQSVSQLGAGVGYIATLWWVHSTTSSALALGALATTSSMVGLVLSPFAGVFVDRWNRKHIIVVTDIIRGLINILLAWAMRSNTLTLPMLLSGVAIKAACGQFFSPAVLAAIPQLVDSEHLEKANSLQQISQNITGMAGYALGGLLVALAGIPSLLLFNGLAYLLSALSEIFIALEPVARASKLNARTVFMDLKGGLAYVKNDRILFAIMQVMVIINFALVPFSVLLPKLVGDHLQAGSDVLGFISSAQMAGMLSGALLLSFTSLVKDNHWLVRWGLGISACALMTSPLARGSMWPVQLLLYGLSGAVMSIVQIFFFSTLQRKIDPAYMGKVFGLNSAMSLGLQPLASFLSGYLADIYPLAMVYAVFGSLVLLGNFRLLAIPGLNAYFGFKNVAARHSITVPKTARDCSIPAEGVGDNVMANGV